MLTVLGRLNTLPSEKKEVKATQVEYKVHTMKMNQPAN